MVTSLAGGISSKIIIGTVCYVLLTIGIIVLSFVNPKFPGLSEIIITDLLTSAGLLGLTTIENIKHAPNNGDTKNKIE